MLERKKSVFTKNIFIFVPLKIVQVFSVEEDRMLISKTVLVIITFTCALLLNFPRNIKVYSPSITVSRAILSFAPPAYSSLCIAARSRILVIIITITVSLCSSVFLYTHRVEETQMSFISISLLLLIMAENLISQNTLLTFSYSSPLNNCQLSIFHSKRNLIKVGFNVVVVKSSPTHL